MRAEQVAAVVVHGGPPSGTTVAEWVAKSRQESSHSETARDFVNQTHVGLWQIAVSHLTPGKKGTAAFEQAAASLENPVTNFTWARKLYGESGWKPWNASGGKPSPTAADKRAAANPEILGGGAVDTVGGLLDDIPVIGDAVTKGFGWAVDAVEILKDAARWIGNPSNIVRIAQVAGGIVLALIAAGIVVKPLVAQTKGALPL